MTIFFNKNKRIISFLLIIIFLLNIIPKKIIHDFISSHKDVVCKNFELENQHPIHYSKVKDVNCFTELFINFSPLNYNEIQYLFNSIKIFFSYNTIQIFFINSNIFFKKKARGPPKIFI